MRGTSAKMREILYRVVRLALLVAKVPRDRVTSLEVIICLA